MLGSLRGDAPDRGADLAPAGAVPAGRLGRLLTESIGRSTKQIGEAEGSQRRRPFIVHAADSFAPTLLYQDVHSIS
jgi:hypothetical protein